MSNELRGWLAGVFDALFPECRACAATGRNFCDCVRRTRLHSDDDYYLWLEKVGHLLVEGRLHPISPDEVQWAERAVYEGWFKWARAEYGLELGERGSPPPAPREPMPTPYDEWITGVVTCLGAERDAYDLDDAERSWAKRAVKAGLLEWIEEERSVRLRGQRRPRPDGPYR